jgi:RHS repeat-associated protein
VWKKQPNGNESLYFYGAFGEMLGEYSILPYTGSGSPYYVASGTTRLYFGGKLINYAASSGSFIATLARDRLGSVIYNSSLAIHNLQYYPDGQEYTATNQNTDKFATYYRDQTTVLDYAQNRYYSSIMSRYMTADPYDRSMNPANPGTFNRYTYVNDDPVNRNDPTGLCPPGYVPATTTAQLQSIVNAAETYVNQGLTHANNSHYVVSAGVLNAIDCTGLVAEALAGIAYTKTGFQAPSLQDQFNTSQIPSMFSQSSTWQVGDIIFFGNHAGIVTGVSNGMVTSFVGSQTSTGPANVNLTPGSYWANQLSTAKAYTPCVPAPLTAGVNPLQPSSGGTTGTPPVDPVNPISGNGEGYSDSTITFFAVDTEIYFEDADEDKEE